MHKKRHSSSSNIQQIEGKDAFVPQHDLDMMNVPQSREENKDYLDQFGGIEILAQRIGTDLKHGLNSEQVQMNAEFYGYNQLPRAPIKTFIQLLFEAFQDIILIILIFASIISLVIGSQEDPDKGWIEGVAILIAVVIVAFVTAGNNYSKELQFRALEESSKMDERTTVLRNGSLQLINPEDLVVGDVVALKIGDGIPADGIIFYGVGVKSNESALTGEPEDLNKTPTKDCFLLSSCLITDVSGSSDARMLVIGIGAHSQWGKIRANLVSNPEATPLQQKLEDMSKRIGYVGSTAAFGTFIALIIMIWAMHNGSNIKSHLIEAIIITVTLIVVAIPEGLPLAVTISLAYSTKKMYKDNNLIRVLAACETMGNATNICSDKTGTLTQNRMTVVEGWFADKVVSQTEMSSNEFKDPSRLQGSPILASWKDILTENISLNRVTRLQLTNELGEVLPRPKVIGNATEGALLFMANDWGYNCEDIKETIFDSSRGDRVFPFNSSKKRSTAILHRPDGSVRVYTKGATEWILQGCTTYLNQNGVLCNYTGEINQFLLDHVGKMAGRALRTLCLAHRDFSSIAELPADWETSPPDSEELTCDCIVGIMDPLRDDVKDAIKLAQHAGVKVRMVTGDNLITARAIATQCGILTKNGICLEGPEFRKLTPAQLDDILPNLDVIARSSPEDKYILVTRLNGQDLPTNEKEWLIKHPNKEYHKERDLLLPGYKKEWTKAHPNGGEVVGVTGDGTNDAPALKAADVGLAMGITGTQVAKDASDIVILDDRFSSIVKAIKWGRSVYDNIRKFLQFQLTVNAIALSIVFIGAVSGVSPPLNAVMMLWVNLIMDTMGALALGTEPPTDELLKRRPYKRSAVLVSAPILRNIICQGLFQLIVLVVLLYKGDNWFGVHSGNWCATWRVSESDSKQFMDNICCGSFKDGLSCDDDVVEDYTLADCKDSFSGSGECYDEYFADLKRKEGQTFADKCLTCSSYDYTHYSIIFNTFVFCQVFNEFNARSLFNDKYVLKGLITNRIFITVIILTVGFQAFVIEVGSEFTRTSGLTVAQWFITIAIGACALPIGFLMRFIPVQESENDFCGTPYESGDINESHSTHFHFGVSKKNEELGEVSEKLTTPRNHFDIESPIGETK